ncbi:MAG: ABC transporter ATP-binding protein [Aequorivita sp.]|nr:ABC transporter ATP-binding protein [Aequorivita sp.]
MKLQIENLTKTYPNGVKAMDAISLQIGIGMFGLLGPNGAGKSSLMRTLATLQLPDKGARDFNGLNVLQNPMELRKQLGYLPQDFGVYPKQSARKLLDYFALLKGISSKKERDESIEYVLELTNLTEVQKKNVSEYSGGLKQRFGIAQLLLNKPKLIIVDEPTAGLDPEERHRFLNVLRAVGSEHIVLFSTHIVEDVTDLCTDLAIMDKGKVLKSSTPKRAIEALNGTIWSKTIATRELGDYQSDYDIISSHYTENNQLVIRVFSKVQPDATFKTSNPNLEDVYFVTLNHTV